MDGNAPADSELVQRTAAAIVAAFRSYNDYFGEITRRAARRFAEQDWKLGQRDAVERIDLYERRIERCVAELVGQMGRRIADEATWVGVKSAYATLISSESDREFWQTFFNSVTRRIFATEGVNPEVEFDALECEPSLDEADLPLLGFGHSGDLARLAAALVGEFPCNRPVAGLPAAIARIQAELQRLEAGALRRIVAVELLTPVFYRFTRAYLVGRILGEEGISPLVLAFRNTDDGPELDAVLTEPEDVRPLFGFSRSYFHADLPRVGPVVGFLRTIMPGKSLAELYTVLGRARQGKTERYRSLYRHLANSDDQFVPAEGVRGMVMAVFTLASYDSVFKVIRDRFPYPKTTSREEVMERYRFVFKHDRVGRLVDAQEFRRLRFPRERFSPAVLEELLTECAATCRIEGDDLIVSHCYVERRLAPLDIFLRTASPEKALAAVRDYGRAIRELALSNVFPGDLLLKNFGVSTNGRVIFYDYDELCLVTDCTYRDLPAARFDEDETRAEPWFYVAPGDVFPEQWLDFLGLSSTLREEFVRYHGDLLTASYWRQLKACHESEQLLEVVPYSGGLTAGNGERVGTSSPQLLALGTR